MNILIVDDSATMRSILSKVLSMAPLEIDTIHQAGNGREGLELLSREKIDLVLADINMPEMGGLEMIEKIKADPNLAHLPILVISSDSSKTRSEELRKKAIHYVRKPFTPEKVAAEINALMKEKRDATRCYNP
jgi:two-component system chemotaxis response regulator CheY